MHVLFLSQGQEWNIAELAFSKLAEIVSVAPHFVQILNLGELKCTRCIANWHFLIQSNASGKVGAPEGTQLMGTGFLVLGGLNCKLQILGKAVNAPPFDQHSSLLVKSDK